MKAVLPADRIYRLLDQENQEDLRTGKLKPSLFPRFYLNQNKA